MRLIQQQLASRLWGATNIRGGRTTGQDYKHYTLSLMLVPQAAVRSVGERGGHA